MEPPEAAGPDARRPEEGHLAALLKLARLLLGQAKAEQASRVLERVIRLAPGDPETLLLLAEALNLAGRRDEALALCRKARTALAAGSPQASGDNWAEVLTSSAWTFLGQGRLSEAESMFKRAVAADPRFAGARTGLASIAFENRLYGEAESEFAQAAALAPSSPEPQIGLSATFAAMGRSEEAVPRGAAAVALAPKSVEARLAHCMAHLRIIYENRDQILEARQGYMAALRELADTVSLEDASEVKAASRVLGGLAPFYLPYQGLCDVEPQRLYGGFAARLAAAAWPEHARPLPPRPLNTPLRVGIVSAFFANHSNWKMHIRDWLENLDPQRFSIYCYHTGQAHDAITDLAKRLCPRFVQGPRTVEDMAPLIKSHRPHVLLYPEIGMHPLTFKLAALRLAPVQCATWGHPETSGLPTIDYFLSSALMEPPGAREHYTERLILLPNLSTRYLPPEVPEDGRDRAAFGLPEGDVLYLCAQSLFKYLPQDDDIFPRIARQTPNCRFVFLVSQGWPGLTKLFTARLGKAFARHGLDPDRHLILVDRLSLPAYHALNRRCDVFLDTFGWSGCNTTLEALASGLPVVTMPSPLMRGRHSTAILSMMGHGDSVAATTEEYIRMAVDLGRDRERREEARARVLADRHKAYADDASARALEEFLISVAS